MPDSANFTPDLHWRVIMNGTASGWSWSSRGHPNHLPRRPSTPACRRL